YHGGTGNDVVLTRTATPALAVSSVVVNAGEANLVQRSLVTNVTVAFSRLVSFVGPGANAFQLTRTGPGATGHVTLAVDLSVSTDPGYVSFLDFNGDGAINGTDLTQFRNRFGVILP